MCTITLRRCGSIVVAEPERATREELAAIKTLPLSAIARALGA